MPRGPATNPIPKLPTWQKRPICGECGNKIRRPRPEKSCSRCRELLDITEFPHNSANADHRESYDRVCKRDHAERKHPQTATPRESAADLRSVSGGRADDHRHRAVRDARFVVRVEGSTVLDQARQGAVRNRRPRPSARLRVDPAAGPSPHRDTGGSRQHPPHVHRSCSTRCCCPATGSRVSSRTVSWRRSSAPGTSSRSSTPPSISPWTKTHRSERASAPTPQPVRGASGWLWSSSSKTSPRRAVVSCVGTNRASWRTSRCTVPTALTVCGTRPSFCWSSAGSNPRSRSRSLADWRSAWLMSMVPMELDEVPA